MIPKEELINRFLIISPKTQLRYLIAAFLIIPDDKRMRWYAVLKLDSQQWAVLSFGDLLEAVVQQGDEILDLPLNSIPDLYVGAEAVGQESMGIGQARRKMYEQPNRRLVVLKNEQPVGLLCDVFQAGIVGGTPLELYGKPEQKLPRGTIQYPCPHCGTVSDFTDLIDPEANQLVCPNCHRLVPEE